MSSLLASKKKKQDILPAWMATASPSLKSLYLAYKEIETELENKIQNTNEEIIKTQRTIVKAKVAERAEVNESNFRKDREIPAKILEEISASNKRLELLYQQKISTHSEGKHKSKADLESEVGKLKKEVEVLRNDKYKSFFELLIDNQLTENQKNLAEKNLALELRVKELEEVVANLRKQNLEYMRQLNS